MIRILAAFCFSMLIGFSAIAQTTNFVNGFVVTMKGDTVKGLLKKFDLSSKATSLVVFMDKKGKKTRYKPKDLRSYKVGTDVYETKVYARQGVNVPPLIAFMKVISKGPVTLYAYAFSTPGGPIGTTGVSTVSMDQTNYYLEKPGVPLHFVKKAKFRKEIVLFLSESEELLRRIEEEKLKYSDIRIIVNIYNNDMREKGIE